MNEKLFEMITDTQHAIDSCVCRISILAEEALTSAPTLRNLTDNMMSEPDYVELCYKLIMEEASEASARNRANEIMHTYNRECSHLRDLTLYAADSPYISLEAKSRINHDIRVTELHACTSYECDAVMNFLHSQYFAAMRPAVQDILTALSKDRFITKAGAEKTLDKYDAAAYNTLRELRKIIKETPLPTHYPADFDLEEFNKDHPAQYAPPDGAGFVFELAEAAKQYAEDADGYKVTWVWELFENVIETAEEVYGSRWSDICFGEDIEDV